MITRPTLRIVLATLALLCALGLVALFVFRPEIRVSITEGQVQSEVAERLPRTVEKSLLTMEVQNLEIDFLASGKVHVTGEMNLSGVGLSGHAVVDATSGLRYENGEFFLVDATLDDVRVTPAEDTQQKLEDAEVIADSLWDGIKARVAEEREDAQEALDRMGDRFLDTATETISTHLNDLVSSTPIYSLRDKGITGNLATMALTDITIAEDSATAVLDPTRITGHLIFQALLLIAALLASLGFAASFMIPSRA